MIGLTGGDVGKYIELSAYDEDMNLRGYCEYYTQLNERNLCLSVCITAVLVKEKWEAKKVFISLFREILSIINPFSSFYIESRCREEELQLVMPKVLRLPLHLIKHPVKQISNEAKL